MAKLALTLARIALAVLLLAWLATRVHWGDYEDAEPDGDQVVRTGLATNLREMNVPCMAGAVAAMTAAMVMAALRWRLLLRVQRIHVRVAEVLRLAFLAEFFSTFLPGRLGGDAAKAYCLARKTSQIADVLVSILVDRLMGLSGLAWLAVAALAVAWSSGAMEPDSMRASLLSLVVVSGLLGTAAVFLFSAKIRRARLLRRFAARLPFAQHIAAAGRAVDIYRRHGACLLQGMAYTFLAHLLDIAAVALIGAGLGLCVTWRHYFLFVPLILIITAVPVTPGAVGLMEDLFVLYFAAAGNPNKVLAMALLVRVATVLCAVPGAFVAALEPRLLRQQQDAEGKSFDNRDADDRPVQAVDIPAEEQDEAGRAQNQHKHERLEQSPHGQKPEQDGVRH